MLADVEGSLKINLGGNIFFEEDDILLLELVVALIKWLHKIESGEIVDLYYESMDYEEQPILAFITNDGCTWHLYSVWQNFNDSSHISLNVLLQTTKNFIIELITHLQTNFCLDLSSLLRGHPEAKIVSS